MSGEFEWPRWDDAPTPAIMEDDEQLRARVLYVAGDGPAQVRAIQVATGLGLDEIADRYSLRRRRV